MAKLLYQENFQKTITGIDRIFSRGNPSLFKKENLNEVAREIKFVQREGKIANLRKVISDKH